MDLTTNNNNNSTTISNADDDITTSNNIACSLAPSLYNHVDYNGSAIYTDDVDINGGYNEDTIITFIIVIAFMFLFLITMFCEIQRQMIENSSNGNGRRQSSTGYHVHSRTVGSGIRLSLENRVELYNKTFDSNGNQLTLKNKHFITKTMKGNENENNNGATEGVEKNNQTESFVDIELGDDTNGNDDDDSSIHLPFESDRKISSSNQSSITTSTKSLRLDHHHHNNMINGTCIICFEDFIKEDVIVWSNDSSCNHIYHKECMVNYLAQNAQRIVTSPLDITDNPCPTCRRPNYCVVSDDDLVQLLSSLQPKTTIRTETATAAGNNRNNDDDDDNDETSDEVATITTTITTTTTTSV